MPSGQKTAAFASKTLGMSSRAFLLKHCFMRICPIRQSKGTGRLFLELQITYQHTPYQSPQMLAAHPEQLISRTSMFWCTKQDGAAPTASKQLLAW
jgi:hypothetical protein